MQFEKFILKNYKGIQNIEIESPTSINHPKKLLVFLGLNESGKTTILEGINLIGTHCREFKDTTTPIIPNGPGGLLSEFLPKIGTIFDGEIVFGAILKEDQNTYDVYFKYSYVKGSFQHYSVSITKNGSFLETTNMQQSIEKINQVPIIYYYDDPVFDIPEKIVFVRDEDPNKVENPNQGEWHRILQDIVDSSNTGRSTPIDIYQDIVRGLAQEQEGIGQISQFVAGISAYINKEILKNWKKAFKSGASIKELRLEYQITEKGVDFYFRVYSKESIPFDLRDRSKGAKWFFSFMTYTVFRQKHNSGNVIFLLDEPASNLYGDLQEVVENRLSKLSEEMGVIYTTHSPYLLDAIEKRTHIRLIENKSSSSEFSFPKIICRKYKEDQDSIRPLLDNVCFNIPRIIEQETKTNQHITPKAIITNILKKVPRAIIEKIIPEVIVKSISNFLQ